MLAFIVVPMMLSAAYAARTGNFSLAMTEKAASAPVAINPAQAPSNYADPLQRSVWSSGVKAVQQALAQPGYTGFAGSYINVAAGHVVTLCGEVAGTSGYDGTTGGQRFISVFGQAQATVVEGSDASFGILWNRVCSRDEGSV